MKKFRIWLILLAWLSIPCASGFAETSSDIDDAALEEALVDDELEDLPEELYDEIIEELDTEDFKRIEKELEEKLLKAHSDNRIAA